MDGPTLVGRTIGGRYAVDALVGEGAMGAVYRARQLLLGTTVAIKVLHRPLHGDPSFAARFLEEARSASRIVHPGSVRVLDFGEDPDGLLYIVMEFLDGRPLDDVLREEGTLAASRIVDIASQVLAALAVAHELGIIHRDLKPENIMLVHGTDDEGRPRDVVKVCDFGVAKQLDPRADRARVTGEGIVIGTPAYMSPEQARGDVLDARSDLYAVGVLIFQLMTGKLPFDGATPMGTALMHVTDEPTRPRLLNPSADERLEALCLRAMSKRAADRPSSAREMRAELRGLLAEPVPEVAGQTVPSLMDQVRPRARRGGLLVAAGLVLVTGSVGLLAYGRQHAAMKAGMPIAEAEIRSPVVVPGPRTIAPVPAPVLSEVAARADAPASSSEGSPAREPEAPVRNEATSARPDRGAATTTARRTTAPRRGGVRNTRRVSSPASSTATADPRAPVSTPVVGAASAHPTPAADATPASPPPAESPAELLPLPVFPDPPPPEADPFDAPR